MRLHFALQGRSISSHSLGSFRNVARDFLAKDPSPDFEALDEALTKLAVEDPAKAELVKLRFFAGLTMPEIARVLRISLATAERHWTYARTWLYAELKDRGNSETP